jgi:L-ribulose-5-phosphate 4-epimerase
MKEGYYKFSASYSGVMTLDEGALDGLNAWRGRLRMLGMIGAYESGELAGIGFGNISCRTPGGFLITATATGQLPALEHRHYCEVVTVNLERNTVSFLTLDKGITPSSECMTHGAIYAADEAIGAVIHVHHSDLWRQLMDRYPTTSKAVEYGTPEMGLELMRLYRESDLPQRRVAVMGGHEDGIIAFGSDIEAAGQVLLDAYRLVVLAKCS